MCVCVCVCVCVYACVYACVSVCIGDQRAMKRRDTRLTKAHVKKQRM